MEPSRISGIPDILEGAPDILAGVPDILEGSKTNAFSMVLAWCGVDFVRKTFPVSKKR